MAPRRPGRRTGRRCNWGSRYHRGRAAKAELVLSRSRSGPPARPGSRPADRPEWSREQLSSLHRRRSRWRPGPGSRYQWCVSLIISRSPVMRLAASVTSVRSPAGGPARSAAAISHRCPNPSSQVCARGCRCSHAPSPACWNAGPCTSRLCAAAGESARQLLLVAGHAEESAQDPQGGADVARHAVTLFAVTIPGAAGGVPGLGSDSLTSVIVRGRFGGEPGVRSGSVAWGKGIWPATPSPIR